MLIVFWIACAVIGYLMLAPFQRGGTGAVLGALLGPIGLVIAFFMRDNAKLDEQRRDRP